MHEAVNSGPASAAEADGLPLQRRRWAVAVIALGITMAVMDAAIANVALPTITRDFRIDPAFSIWIVNGYQLAITISLLPLSSLGDIVGYRRIYLAGLALFTAASLACALSPTLTLLTAARILQGFGAAGIMSVNTALVRFIYPHRSLGRGLGFNAMVVAVSAALGPTIAAGILSIATWPWLFAVNVPIGIAACILGARCLPSSPLARHPFDLKSAGLSALTFGALITSIDVLAHGETFPLFLLQIAVTFGLGWLLVRRQLASQAPLFPVDLMRIPIFTLSVATSICSFAAQMLAMVSLPFFLQEELHYSAVQTGLFLTPWPIAIGIAAPIAGRLADRYPAGLLGGAGLGVFAAGLLALAFLPAHPSAADIIWRMALAGAGFGLFQSPNNRAMIGSAPRERSGGASGMLGTARLLGQTTGAAIVALLFARIPQSATTVALLMGTGLALVAAFVSLMRLYEPLAVACTRTSNPEADPNLRADLLRRGADEPAKRFP
jgi:MFS transporter, DHA2 family, multidrug resistance protein